MLGIGKLCYHACEHRAGDMTGTVTIMIVETYAATILIAGLPAHIDDPHPGVVQMGGEPRRACERRAINGGHNDTCKGRALILVVSKSNRKVFLLLAHSCSGGVRHVRSWRKPTPTFQAHPVGQPTKPCLGEARQPRGTLRLAYAHLTSTMLGACHAWRPISSACGRGARVEVGSGQVKNSTPAAPLKLPLRKGRGFKWPHSRPGSRFHR
jgi:hypothetical protein